MSRGLKAQYRLRSGQLALVVRVEQTVTADLLGAVIAYEAWAADGMVNPAIDPGARKTEALDRVESLPKGRVEQALRHHLREYGAGELGLSSITEGAGVPDAVLEAGEDRARRLLAGE